MAVELAPEDKKGILEQHLKSVAFSEYNITLSLIEANAMSEKNQSNIDSLNNQLSDITAQKNALTTEYNSVLAQIQDSE